MDKIERIYQSENRISKQRAKTKRVPYFLCGNFRKKTKKRRFTCLRLCDNFWCIKHVNKFPIAEGGEIGRWEKVGNDTMMKFHVHGWAAELTDVW